MFEIEIIDRLLTTQLPLHYVILGQMITMNIQDQYLFGQCGAPTPD
jgi:hypothetical protein